MTEVSSETVTLANKTRTTFHESIFAGGDGNPKFELLPSEITSWITSSREIHSAVPGYNCPDYQMPLGRC
jgi:hypothetical protein